MKMKDYIFSIKETSINNQSDFYTDSNGYYTIKRTLFKREDY